MIAKTATVTVRDTDWYKTTGVAHTDTEPRNIVSVPTENTTVNQEEHEFELARALAVQRQMEAIEKGFGLLADDADTLDWHEELARERREDDERYGGWFGNQ
jgi:hypothetical protein